MTLALIRANPLKCYGKKSQHIPQGINYISFFPIHFFFYYSSLIAFEVCQLIWKLEPGDFCTYIFLKCYAQFPKWLPWIKSVIIKTIIHNANTEVLWDAMQHNEYEFGDFVNPVLGLLQWWIRKQQEVSYGLWKWWRCACYCPSTKHLSLLLKYLLWCCLFVTSPQLILTTTWNSVPVPFDSRGDLLRT